MKYELAEPDKYYTAQINNATGERFFQEERYAAPVIINDWPLDLFGCEGIDDYTISDGVTGRRISGGNTKKEAVKNTKNRIEKNGGVDAVLKSEEKFDLSPRYRKVK